MGQHCSKLELAFHSLNAGECLCVHGCELAAVNVELSLCLRSFATCTAAELQKKACSAPTAVLSVLASAQSDC